MSILTKEEREDFRKTHWMALESLDDIDRYMNFPEGILLEQIIRVEFIRALDTIDALEAAYECAENNVQDDQRMLNNLCEIVGVRGWDLAIKRVSRMKAERVAIKAIAEAHYNTTMIGGAHAALRDILAVINPTDAEGNQ